MSEIVYHYCSVEVFKSIIENRKLWLASSTNTNDSMENSIVSRKLFETMSDEEDYEKYTSIFSEFDEIYKKLHVNTYISCFSMNRDLLSQWRGYADDGNGIAIGFDKKSLPEKRDIIHYSFDTENTISSNEVLYDCEDVDKFVSDCITAVKKLHTDKTKDAEDKLIIYALKLLTFNYITKSSAFSEEEEFRTVYIPFPNQGELGAFISMKDISDRKFRFTKNKISSYYEMNISYNDFPKPISEIVLGPKNKFDEDELKLFLKSNGFTDIKITRSAATYC
mgnify:CR=1 FL=1